MYTYTYCVKGLQPMDTPGYCNITSKSIGGTLNVYLVHIYIWFCMHTLYSLVCFYANKYIDCRNVWLLHVFIPPCCLQNYLAPFWHLFLLIRLWVHFVSFVLKTRLSSAFSTLISLFPIAAWGRKWGSCSREMHMRPLEWKS